MRRFWNGKSRHGLIIAVKARNLESTEEFLCIESVANEVLTAKLVLASFALLNNYRKQLVIMGGATM